MPPIMPEKEKPAVMIVSDSTVGASGGGAQISMRILFQGLADRFHMMLFSPGKSGLNEDHHIASEFTTFNLRRIGWKGFLRVSFLLLRAIRRNKPDIVHLQMSSTTIMFHALYRLGLIPKKTRVIITDRGIYGKASKLTTRSIDNLVNRASAIVTTTEINRQNYAQSCLGYAKHPSKFRVIPNTAGFVFEQADGNGKTEVRKKLGFGEDTLILGFCGRYSAEKNWPLAKEIAFFCTDRIPDSEVVMIFSANRYEDRVRKASEFIEGIRERIGSRLHAYIDIPNDDVMELYRIMDVFILTSSREPFGRTAIEAMAKDTVVIGTRVDGIPEVIGNDRYLYDTAEQALEIIEETHKNPVFAEESRRYFAERYRDNYTVSRNLEMHNRLYEDILKDL